MIANLKIQRADEDTRVWMFYGMHVTKATYTIPTLFDEKEYFFTIQTPEEVSDEYVENKIVEKLLKDLEPKE